MRQLVLAFALSVLLVGTGTAQQDNAPLKGPNNGATPRVANASRNQQIPGSSSALGRETPFGYEVSQGHTEDLKSMSASTTALGGTPNGTGGTLATNTASSFFGMGQNGWIPYDAGIVAGPNHVIVMSNAEFAIYTKAGALVSLTQFDSFFGTAAGTAFDPKCFYDASAGHFVMLADMQSNPNAFMNVAVSQTSDPTGAWWIYQLDWTLDGSTKTSNWGDYPSLGYDDNAIYIGANQYSFSNSYKYSKVRVLSKAQLYSGATATWTDFINLLNSNGTSAFTVKAGRMLGSSPSVYLLNTLPGGGSFVTLWRIDNAPAAPTLTRVATVTVGSYAVPPNGRQPGGSSVASGDCRTQDVVVQNGVVYTAFSEKYGSNRRNQGAGIRYLEITTSGVKNKDISYFYSGIDQFYPAVTVDSTGNMYMVFSRSSSTQYASIYQTGMKTTETAIESPGLVKAGTSTITDGRWGDYSAVANDPVSSGTVWEYSGWANSGGAWATWVVAASFGVPLAPAVAVNQPHPNFLTSATPSSFTVDANYPNPFNPATTISFQVPARSRVQLKVFNVLGQEVKTLADEELDPGTYQRQWMAEVTSGIYFYRLEAVSVADPGVRFSEVRKMILLK